MQVGRLVGALDVDNPEPFIRMVVAAGEATRVALCEHGLRPAITTIDPSPTALARALAAALGGRSDDERG